MNMYLNHMKIFSIQLFYYINIFLLWNVLFNHMNIFSNCVKHFVKLYETVFRSTWILLLNLCKHFITHIYVYFYYNVLQLLIIYIIFSFFRTVYTVLFSENFVFFREKSENFVKWRKLQVLLLWAAPKPDHLRSCGCSGRFALTVEMSVV